ncbi:MAG: RES family NAD+ phosphorylase [Luteolibacter sp.]
MISAFRLCANRYLSSAFSGEGAKIAGGRWNSDGRPMVYCASSLSLATLEVLVHLEEPEILERYFSYFEIRFPAEMVTETDLGALPKNWRSEDGLPATRSLGDEWLVSFGSPVLSVPSAVTPGELNFLLNPRHPDFRKIEIGNSETFSPDPRLVR